MTSALTAIADVRAIIETAIVDAPRSQQRTIGPSELGSTCDRCLINKIAGTPAKEVGVPWLPTIGTAVHEWLEMTMIRHLAATGSDRWLPEAKVMVGEVDGTPIWGTCDLYDKDTGTVIDFKVVGATTLKKVRSDGSGCSQTYRRQAQLYGRGMALAGDHVRHVAVWFLPRNAISLSEGRVYSAPYDETVALETLSRATRFAQWVRHFGAEQVLASAAPHNDQEFSCDTYPGPHATAPRSDAGAFTDLLAG